MSHRPWRVEIDDDVLIKRRRQLEQMTSGELLGWLTALHEHPDTSGIEISAGTFVEWYSPETEEEAENYRASTDATNYRKEKHEYTFFQRLLAMYGEDGPPNPDEDLTIVPDKTDD